MGKTYLGARRKRTNTPAENRKRAVEFRHQRYARSAVPETAENEIAEISEIIAVNTEDKAAENTETAAPVTAAEPAAETVHEVEEAPASADPVGGFFQKVMTFFSGLFGIQKAVDAIDAAAEETYSADRSAETAEEEVHAAEEVSELTESEPAEAASAEEDDDEAQETIGEWPAVTFEKPAEEKETEESTGAEAEEAEEKEAEASETSEEAEKDTSEEKETEETSEEKTEESTGSETEETETTGETEETAEEKETETSETSEEAEKKEVASEEKETETSEDTETAAEKAVTDEETAEESEESEETEKTEKAVTSGEESEEEAEPVPEEQPKPKPKTFGERIQEFQAYRRRKKLEDLDEMIDRPKANIFDMILKPGTAMERVSKVEYATVSRFTILALNIVKWIIFGSFFAHVLRDMISAVEYSTVQINFTFAAGIAFKIALFALAAEYASYYLFTLISGLLRKPVSMASLLDVEGRSSLSSALVFLLACFIVRKNTALGFAAIIAGLIYEIAMKTYGIGLAQKKLSRNVQFWLIALITAVAAFLSFSYFRLTMGNVVEVFSHIMNLPK